MNKKSNIPLIGIYGVTSVGKSTFLNSLLGTDSLKVGMGETTRKIHVIQHVNNSEKYWLDNIKIPLEHLLMDRKILEEFSLVDVPGSNKSFADEDIESLIQELDVVVWMFDLHGDISATDNRFLKQVLLKNMMKTIIILNKVDSGVEDILDAEEKKEFIEDIIHRKNKIENFFIDNGAKELLVSIIPISAKKISKIGKEQLKNIKSIISSASVNSLDEKILFRQKYPKVEDEAFREIELEKQKILHEVSLNVKDILASTSDEEIMSDDYSLGDANQINFEIEKITPNYELLN